MNGHEHWPTEAADRRLAELLSDAVADVTPDDRLADIRERTSTRPTPRPWLVAGGGAALATAAVVTAIALAGGNPAPSTDPGPAASTASPSPSVSERPSGEDSPSGTTAPPVSASTSPGDGGGTAVPVYYAGETPAGLRLYREFRHADEDPLFASAQLAVSGTPLDPDYRTLWPAGAAVTGAAHSDNFIQLNLEGVPATRPAGMTGDDAALALQQVVYSVQGTLGRGRVPVEFRLDGQPAAQLLGVPTSEPVTNAPALQTLALVNLTTPEEGATVSGSFDVEGVASSFEANVPWTIRDGTGDVVGRGSFTAEGWMDRLYPFRGTVDVSSLDPGTYTLIVETDDPAGGAEGFGPFSDSRTIVIE